MNKRNLGVALLAACMIGLFGCSEHSPSGVDNTQRLNPESGRFGMSSLGKLEKRTREAAVQQGAQVKFNLGKIRGSSGFFFLLYNVGMTPITNVTLSIDNAAFSVFPTSMDTLIPGNDVGMLPVVKIAAFHGTPYDGVGNRPLLPQGKNDCVLHIQGTSKTSSGADTTIVLDAVMSLEAVVMNLTLNGINEKLSASHQVFNPELSSFASVVRGVNYGYYFQTSCIGDSVLTIHNTGNVIINYIIYRSQFIAEIQGHVVDTISSSSVLESDSMDIVLKGDSKNVSFLMEISGGNAVADPGKLILNDNGKLYVRILKGSVPCPDAQVQQRYEKFLSDRAQNTNDKIWVFLDNRVIVYSEKFTGSDSVKAMLYDLSNDQLLTSFSGSGYILYQENDYSGEYLTTFIRIAESMFMVGDADKKFGIDPQRITGGGKSNWVITKPIMMKFIPWEHIVH